jgi:hypothetical protein
VDSLGNYSSRHELCLVAFELQKHQDTHEHANMKADEHADAQQKWEQPTDGLPNESGCRSRAHGSLVTGARTVAVPDRPSSRSQ